MIKKFTLFLLAALACAPAFAQEFSGKVVGISDGDTLTVLDGRSTTKVRLAEIDAPEKSQAHGQQSKRSLSDMCFGKEAVVEVFDTDRYGRTVGKVSCDGINVNRAQLQAGMAWVYAKYAKDRTLIEVERGAKVARRGLWSDDNPTPPWEYRKANR